MEGKQYLDVTIARYAQAKNHALESETLSTDSDRTVVPVIIEVPKSCPNKYEIDKQTGLLTLDRVLHSSVYYPGNYGFVPNTLCGDGDPIDVVVLSQYPLNPGVVVYARIIGVLEMVDEKGEDFKLIAVIDRDPRYAHVNDALKLAAHTRNVISNFFKIYKDLENKWSDVREMKGREAALQEYLRSVEMYRQHYKDLPAEEKLLPPDYNNASIKPYSVASSKEKGPILDYPYKVSVFIEVPAGGNNKYEFDHNSGMMKLDRVLHSAVFYPYEYGFIPQTLAEDGDPLDCMVISSYSLLPGSMVDVRIIGVLLMEDQNGKDNKILGVVDNDPRFLEWNELTSVSPHAKTEISHFFETYKNLEKGTFVRVEGWRDKNTAAEIIVDCHSRYLQQINHPLENVPRFDRMEISTDYPSIVNAFVTTSKGSSVIYRYDKITGLLRLDRRLHSSMYFPANVGFIPQTTAEDAEELDIIILSYFELECGSLVPCRLVGKLDVEDERGPDSKMVAVPVGEPRMAEIKDIEDIPRHLKDEIYNFYQNYKVLEDKHSWTRVKDWHNKATAEQQLRRSHDRYFLYGVRIEELQNKLATEQQAKQELAQKVTHLESIVTSLQETVNKLLTNSS